MESANKDGCKPLYRAAVNDHLEVVRELLKHGAKVESAKKGVWTTLYTAALNGHVEVVRELLKHGAKMESAIVPPEMTARLRLRPTRRDTIEM